MVLRPPGCARLCLPIVNPSVKQLIESADAPARVAELPHAYESRERCGPAHTARHALRASPPTSWPTSGEVVTYAELDARSNRLAQLLHARGLRFGDHIAVCLENSPRFLEVTWAAQRSGLVYTPINYHLTAEEMAYIVGDCDARAYHHQRGAGDDADGAAPRSCGPQVHDPPRRSAARCPATNPTRTRSPRSRRPPLAEELEGVADAVLLRHDRPAEGRRARRTRACRWAAAAADGGLRAPVLGHRRHRVSLAGAALSRRAAALLHDASCAPAARWWSWSASIRSRRWRSSSATASPTASGCRRCSSACSSCRRRARAARSRRRTASPSTPRRRARSPVKEQMIEWWGPIMYEYYSATEGIGATDDRQRRSGSRTRARSAAPLAGTIHILDDDGRELPLGESGSHLLRSRRRRSPFAYHKDPTKTAARAQRRRAGGRSATSATSTPTATSTSPTARTS